MFEARARSSPSPIPRQAQAFAPLSSFAGGAAGGSCSTFLGASSSSASFKPCLKFLMPCPRPLPMSAMRPAPKSSSATIAMSSISIGPMLPIDYLAMLTLPLTRSSAPPAPQARHQRARKERRSGPRERHQGKHDGPGVGGLEQAHEPERDNWPRRTQDKGVGARRRRAFEDHVRGHGRRE